MVARGRPDRRLKAIIDAAGRTTAEAVVAALVANGIDTLFCVPGVQNDALMDAFFTCGQIRIVHTRHEQGAAYMALGAAMATGKPQVYAVVPGPGFLNTTAALSTAYACNAPVLALAGQIPQQHIGRGLGFLHEIPDQLGVMRSLTKWAARIDAPQDAPGLVEEAFRQMRSGRPRPVGLECAVDVWPPPARCREQQQVERRADRRVDRSAIEAAAALLGSAQQPLMVVGGGAQHAGAASHGAGRMAADAGRRRPDGIRRPRCASSAQHQPAGRAQALAQGRRGAGGRHPAADSSR